MCISSRSFKNDFENIVLQCVLRVLRNFLWDIQVGFGDIQHQDPECIAEETFSLLQNTLQI